MTFTKPDTILQNDYCTFSLADIEDDKAKEIIRIKIQHPTITIQEIATKLGISRPTIYKKLTEYRRYLDMYNQLEDQKTNAIMKLAQDLAVRNLFLLAQSRNESIRLKTSLAILQGLGTFTNHLNISQCASTITKTEMLAELNKYALRSGLTLEEYADREGLDLDLDQFT